MREGGTCTFGKEKRKSLREHRMKIGGGKQKHCLMHFKIFENLHTLACKYAELSRTKNGEKACKKMGEISEIWYIIFDLKLVKKVKVMKDCE